MFKEYLQKHSVLADGAMGTYYAALTGRDTAFAELANLAEPERIEAIHRQYIEAGAELIRTNTFSANSFSLQLSQEAVEEIIRAGYRLARQAAAGKNVWVAADIGPVPENVSGTDEGDRSRVLAEYLFLADTFLAEGADLFVFETFSSTDYLAEVASHIKRQRPEAFIWAQFATTPDGFTRRGISNERIVREVKQIAAIDAYGFNCGVGPTHLYNALKKLETRDSGDIVSVLPNAGYPEIVNERTVYAQNPDYFAEVMGQISALGVRILGGCCGTTPEHIKKTAQRLNQSAVSTVEDRSVTVREVLPVKAVPNQFQDKMSRGEFVVAVELDPPFDTSVDKILHNARLCRQSGVDLITVADSPMAKARVDSVMLAAKIQREAGIAAMPHICCRDKNVNALKSSLLAGHIENLRNVLAVTGDAIASADKNEIKSVFNRTSLSFMELIAEMNCELFKADPYYVGGALNLNVANKRVELGRMAKKAERGASFFLTQPMFADEVIDFLPEVKRAGATKILGGIMPLVSYRNAMFLNNEIPGISIPEEQIRRFDPAMDRAQAETVGIQLAVELARKIKPFVDGFYFITPFNRVDMVLNILRQVI